MENLSGRPIPTVTRTELFYIMKREFKNVWINDNDVAKLDNKTQAKVEELEQLNKTIAELEKRAVVLEKEKDNIINPVDNVKK